MLLPNAAARFLHRWDPLLAPSSLNKVQKRVRIRAIQVRSGSWSTHCACTVARSCVLRVCLLGMEKRYNGPTGQFTGGALDQRCHA